ncbi:MAG TPA: hypothetical protein VMZ69_04525, partial [Saprospiraceae bacterium]|nr:hypothetical protein [Saprospiraceae bacterium]
MKRCNVLCKTGLLFCFLSISLLTFAQDKRKDLESQRKALENQIKTTSDVLKKTQKSKTKSLDQLNALNAQMVKRQELLASINSELSRVKQEAAIQEKNKNETSHAIDELEDKMNHALRTAYIRSQLQPDWIFLLSSQSIGQALTRWVYLRQYKNFVAQQLRALSEKKQKHQQLLMELEENKKVKTQLYNEEEQHKREILQEKKKQEELIKKISTEEKKLKKDLEASQAKKKKLDSEIAR